MLITGSTRRFMLTRTATTILAALVVPRAVAAQGAAPQTNIPKRPDPLLPSLVREFVVKAHGDLDATRQLLAETPTLLNATWDWGGGDFEMAIGGAGHMGNRPIAEFLIGQGGRMDVFVAAMLGHVDVVKAILSINPALLQSKGPHGISLMAHAKAGGAAAEPVVALLEARQRDGQR